MHVLIVPTWYDTADKPWRGTFIRDQALALARSRTRTGVVFVERRSLSRLIGNPLSLSTSHFQIVEREEEGIPTLRMKGWSTFAQTVPGAMLWALLTARLVRHYRDRHGQPSLIHGHAALWGGYATMLAARQLGCPFVVTEHSSAIMTRRLSRWEASRAREVYRNADAVIAVSNRLKAAVDALAGREVARVIPNTVDTGYFTPKVRDRSRPFTFLVVGDLVDYKRVDLILRAYARSDQPSRDSRLVIVGQGKERDLLEALARKLDIDGLVSFTGALPRWRVRHWMRDADALLIGSEFETFGVTAIEALACGVPVLATRSGGPEEIVSSSTGILVPCGDEAAMAEGMAQLRSRRFEAHQLASTAAARYGFAAVATQLDRVYRAVAQEAGARNAIRLEPVVQRWDRATLARERAMRHAAPKTSRTRDSAW